MGAAQTTSPEKTRVYAVARSAAIFSIPDSCRLLANCTMRMPFLAISPTSVISPTCE